MRDFFGSLIHINFLYITIPLATICAFFERIIGLEYYSIVALILLLAMELITGLYAAKINKKQIKSKKFGRFGLKLFVWFGLLFILKSFAFDTNFDSTLETTYKFFFLTLHRMILIYIVIEYLISVLENLTVITGKDNTPIITYLKTVMQSRLGFNKKDDQFLQGINYGRILATKDLGIEKINEIICNFINMECEKMQLLNVKNILTEESLLLLNETIKEIELHKPKSKSITLDYNYNGTLYGRKKTEVSIFDDYIYIRVII
jgi:hypothetical protein